MKDTLERIEQRPQTLRLIALERLRDAILEAGVEGITIDRWERRDEGVVVCETAHRLKGTEWQAAVVASLTLLPALLGTLGERVDRLAVETARKFAAR